MKRIFLFSFLLTLLLGCVSSCSSDEENQQEPERPLYPTSPVTIVSAKQILCETTTDNYYFKVSIVASCGVELSDWGVAVYSNSKIQKTVSVGTPNKTGSVESELEIEVSAANMNAKKTPAVPLDKYYVIPYIQYDGKNVFYEEQKVKLELEWTGCPDRHHPHAIDLGLPSGTKWCCCNVGASTPEGYGGYYAWGEVNEKNYYGWETYAYGSSWDNCQYIGSDIAGTQYDVAHVRMGGSWRMPTAGQLDELLQYCSRQWTQQNGVNGILVTGPNGGQIFLPAAGCRLINVFEGFGGYYWSGSLYSDDDNCASVSLGFGSSVWGWNEIHRYQGQSVRAVCQ